jgi:hypothetical protein
MAQVPENEVLDVSVRVLLRRNTGDSIRWRAI